MGAARIQVLSATSLFLPFEQRALRVETGKRSSLARRVIPLSAHHVLAPMRVEA